MGTGESNWIDAWNESEMCYEEERYMINLSSTWVHSKGESECLNSIKLQIVTHIDKRLIFSVK